MRIKQIIAIIIAGFSICFLPVKAEAAGAIVFDCENSGIAEMEIEKKSANDTWEQIYKKYDYYPNGALKKIRSTNGYLCYEGHYDYNGTLMDPSWAFYSGYNEGILIDHDSEPKYTYDKQGRLIHFEAEITGFDDGVLYIITADYEYDDQNRVARVNVEYYDEEYDDNISEYGLMSSTGWVFAYGMDGSYFLTSESQDSESIYRTSYSYDSEHHLTRYDSSRVSVASLSSNLYSESDTRLYSYDEDGYLTSFLEYYDGSKEPSSKIEYRYQKKNGRAVSCDVYDLEWRNKELKHTQTITYSYDQNGMLASENEINISNGVTNETRYSYKKGADSSSNAPTLSELQAMVASGTVKTKSNKGTRLVLPNENQMVSEPFRMRVDNGKSKGSIYIMPKNEAGHGYLGAVETGTEVWIIAQTNDFYFFVTDDGQMGWNGKSYFSDIRYDKNEPSPTSIPASTPTPITIPKPTSEPVSSITSLSDGQYYGLLTSWTSDLMTIERLNYEGRYEMSLNYILTHTGQYLTLDISQAVVCLEYAWNDGVEVQCTSIDDALNTEIWGGPYTIRENCTMEICFIVKNSQVVKIIFLYAA